MKVTIQNLKKILLLMALAIWQTTTIVFSQPIIVDHTCTDIKKIPTKYILAARKIVLINTGLSHGRQIPVGLEELARTDTLYRVKVADYAPPTGDTLLKVGRSMRNTNWVWPTMGPFEFLTYIPITIDYCVPRSIQVNAFIHTFCWTNQPTGTETSGEHIGAANFCSSLTNIEATYPGYHYIYSTGTCGNNPSLDAYNRQVANQYIRDYCISNNKILYDFADIEAYSSTGVKNFATYNGNEYLMFNPEWAGEASLDNHVGGGGCHVNLAGAVQKAKAVWWLLARLAGWDGVSTEYKQIDNRALQLHIYPNPSDNRIFIKTNPAFKKGIFELSDINGQVLIRNEIPCGYAMVDIGNFKPGLYLIKVMINKQVEIRKILKK